jgi:WD40 repeat protein
VSGELSAAEFEVVAAHVSVCASCADIARQLDDDSEERHWREILGNDPMFAPVAPAGKGPAARAVAGSSLELRSISFSTPKADGSIGQLAEFDIRHELGRGGMGVVFLAHDPRLDRLVAIKVPWPNLAAERQVRDRFEREARCSGRVAHDNVTRVYRVEGGADDFPLPFLVMEYVEGESMKDRLQRQPALEPKEAAEIVRSIARGLAAVHKRNLVHRDIKPSNILFERGTGRVKITDFGLARAVGELTEQITLSGQMVGTSAYMSPESITRPDEIDERGDLFSLGVVLYEAMTGERPFPGETHAAVQQRIVHEEPIAPRRLKRSIPVDLETLCLRCLEKEPDRRPKSAAELAAELDLFLSDRPIKTRPVGPPERLWRWCRRNRALAAALGLAIASLIAVVAIAFTFAVTQRRAANDLRAEQRKLRTRLAENALDRGLAACNERNVSLGVVWFARGLRDAPAEDLELQRTLRTSLAGWLPLVNLPVAALDHTSAVYSSAFSPDGTTILTGCDDGIARLWKWQSGGAVSQLSKQPGSIFAVAFLPGGRTIVTGCADGRVRFWDTESLQGQFQALPHSSGVRTLALSPDGRIMLTDCRDGNARLWEVKTGRLLHCFDTSRGKLRPPKPHPDYMFALAFSPNGQSIATGCADDRIRLWDVKTREMLGDPLEFEALSHAAAFRPTSPGLLATGGSSAFVRLWEFPRVVPHVGLPMLHRDSVFALAFSPDGRVLATGSGDNVVRFWAAETQAPYLSVIKLPSVVWSLSFSPDGRYLLVGSGDGKARVWALAGGNLPARTLVHDAPVYSVAVGPDGKTLLTGSRGARLWNTTSDHPIHVLHPDSLVRRIAYSRDGKSVASTGSPDDESSAKWTTRVWNVGSGKPLGPPISHPSAVFAVALSPEGKAVVTGDVNGEVWLWNVATGKPIDSYP